RSPSSGGSSSSASTTTRRSAARIASRPSPPSPRSADPCSRAPERPSPRRPGRRRAITSGSVADDVTADRAPPGRGDVDDDPDLTPARARQLAHLHAFASSVSAAMLRVRDPRELCETACRFAVERGLAVLAWVGTVEGVSVDPIARFGRDDGYVDLIRIRAGGGELGNGPAVRALRSEQPIVADDIAADATFPWPAEAARRGLRSCA